ncbi:BMP family ABC transporter substrate-binding protein [Streptomyces sp. NPDC056670]|uniref:BMP family ABC transporter substrate-binding protein n=1 Tax=Streptomyces sp. NPDC056670 TaxID=3345904 RepID=UPI0036A52429
MKAWTGARRRWVLGGGAGFIAATVAVIAMVTSGGSTDARIPPTRARAYTEQQACLLTPETGIAESTASQVWGGLQDASAKTRAKVSYLAVAGDQSAGNAAPYLATLAARKCTVVLTVGAAPEGAVTLNSDKFPKTRFLVVEDSTNTSPSRTPSGENVKALSPARSTGKDSDVRSRVASAVENALQG